MKFTLSFETFRKNEQLAAPPPASAKKSLRGTIAPKSISAARKDIADLNEARNLAMSEEPKNYALALLLKYIMDDALLSSQISNRHELTMMMDYALVNADGSVNEEQTSILNSFSGIKQIIRYILEKRVYGYSLIELGLSSNSLGRLMLNVELVPRENVVPKLGMFYPDYSEDKSIPYRSLPEFGSYILEFKTDDFGLINKASPHVIFKRFAQSCWSELCEIYGIPPRVLKTNTQDPDMLKKAEQMMTDMGSAAWFIIDDSEEFEFAKGADTNGDVYRNLIALCNSEISLLVSGAQIGQDTSNGSRSKDESAQEMLLRLVKSDQQDVEADFNEIVVPALIALGLIKGDVRFQFSPVEDIDALWTRTKEVMPYMKVDIDWLVNKFGIKVVDYKENNNEQPATKLKLDYDFFA